MLNARQGKLLNWSTCNKMDETFQRSLRRKQGFQLSENLKTVDLPFYLLQLHSLKSLPCLGLIICVPTPGISDFRVAVYLSISPNSPNLLCQRQKIGLRQILEKRNTIDTISIKILSDVLTLMIKPQNSLYQELNNSLVGSHR